MTPIKAATFEGYLEKSHPTDPSHPNLSIHLSNGIGAAWAIHCKPPGRLASVTVTSPHHWLKVLNFPETACRFAHQSWETATFRDSIINPLPSVIIQWPTKFLPYKLDPKSAITHLHDHSQYLSSTLGSVTTIISLKFQKLIPFIWPIFPLQIHELNSTWLDWKDWVPLLQGYLWVHVHP